MAHDVLKDITERLVSDVEFRQSFAKNVEDPSWNILAGSWSRRCSKQG